MAESSVFMFPKCVSYGRLGFGVFLQMDKKRRGRLYLLVSRYPGLRLPYTQKRAVATSTSDDIGIAPIKGAIGYIKPTQTFTTALFPGDCSNCRNLKDPRTNVVNVYLTIKFAVPLSPTNEILHEIAAQIYNKSV